MSLTTWYTILWTPTWLARVESTWEGPIGSPEALESELQVPVVFPEPTEALGPKISGSRSLRDFDPAAPPRTRVACESETKGQGALTKRVPLMPTRTLVFVETRVHPP